MIGHIWDWLMGLMGAWWPLVLAICLILLIVGWRTSHVRVSWVLLGRVGTLAFVGSLFACYWVFGGDGALAFVLIAGAVAALSLACAVLFKRADVMGQESTEPTTGPLPGDPSRCPELWSMVAAIEAGEYEIPQFADDGGIGHD